MGAVSTTISGLSSEVIFECTLVRPMRQCRWLCRTGDVQSGGVLRCAASPAAVVAALDQRVSTVVPFNFGESTPEIPRFIPERNQWPLDLADPGLSDWETTRCLRRGIIDQFLQWTICAMAAPRRFVYSYEFGWNVEDLPAWTRYKKIYELYHLNYAYRPNSRAF